MPMLNDTFNDLQTTIDNAIRVMNGQAARIDQLIRQCERQRDIIDRQSLRINELQHQLKEMTDG